LTILDDRSTIFRGRIKVKKIVRDSGILEDGSLKAVSPEETRAHLAAMSEDVRALYETVS